jgi:pimeloyl-ACP methyl ester carboxylesterase
MEGLVSARSGRERPEIREAMVGLATTESNFPRRVWKACAVDPEGTFNWDITERLADISRPTVVFVGEEDDAVLPAQSRVLAEKIPGAELRMLKNVGHLYQLERPSEFNRALREFLNRVVA